MFQNNGSDSFEMIHWNSSTAAQKSKFTNTYLLTFSNLIETSVVIYDFTEAALCICSTKYVFLKIYRKTPVVRFLFLQTIE